MSSSIRISKKNHKKLIELAGILQAKLKRTVSIDEAISFILNNESFPGKITDLPDAWDLTDEEVNEIFDTLRNGWKSWTSKKSA
ncbi:MAG: hypothetical protein HWN65_15520 [Candidatus Helarchaeota archaeon]|nr:hypothetical protein [Candidatus Helarchaeota archaeon]